MSKTGECDDPHLWMVCFNDDTQMLKIRKAFGAQHLQFLEDNKDLILLAGGLRFQPDTPFTGGMWIVRAMSKEQVVELIENDPYYSLKHRHYDIQYWGLALERYRHLFCTVN